MRNTTDNNELNRRSSQSEVVIDGDVVIKNGEQRSRSNSTYSADLETAITKTGCGKFSIALMLLTFPAACTLGFDTASMSFIIPAASVDLGLKPSERALLQSSCYAGIISGGILWGFMSDAFGRKKFMVIGFLINALMNILIGAFRIVPLMIVFKYLAGFTISGSYPIFSTYIAEIFPIKRRDIIIMSLGFHASIGQIIQSSLAMWIMPIDVPSEIPFKSWQLFQMACCLPALISGISCIFFVESPKFLADKGNHEGALKVCQTIYSINTGNLSTSYPVKRLNHESRKIENKSNLSKFLEGIDVLRPPFVQKAVVVFLLYLGFIVSYNILRLWLPDMLTLISSSKLNPNQGLCPLLQEGELRRRMLTSSEDLNDEKVYSQMIWVNVVGLIGQILFLLLIRYIGKKIMQFSCTLMAAICSLIMLYISADYVMIVASIYMALYEICVYSTLNIALEIFPTRIRASSIGIMMLIGKSGTFTMNFLMATLGYTYCIYLFYGIALFSIIMAGLTLLIPKKPLEDKLCNPSKGN
ncbi:unnamed protein product [Nezara viridula]|uniref:Major facilitator superfamily (MFS) profile domain-containing protein n=1 Tax=Nezara viridula TaxID=85310 RepID=A0A9P0HRV5_NEZVI|nr:unnamed protein product [Nezara viridula]